MGKKEKKEKRKSEGAGDGEEQTGPSYDELLKFVSVISNPLASRKLTKKLYKLTKKAQTSSKHLLRKGVKDVQKQIRKGEKGIVVMAGDTNPIDVISHMPVVCEEASISYCFTPSREALGAASGSKRPTCMLLIKPNAEYQDLFDEVNEEMKSLPMPVS
ncbi:H/ACA ribonucleoprotein complex subunit 2-like protein [Tubulanus polymorphus]|uniref:H/ACA ribonucleoprotein complex subunit 2-like protein n=1 Tax=Tubulanus polymorphus TaxID=672921 RepID=UPI003DA48E97